MGTVEAADTRNHILELSRAGVGLDTVATLSGIDRATLARIKAGRRRVRTSTAAAILAVPLTSVADHTLVDASETKRRIADLRRRGWTNRAIAHELGRSRLRTASKVTAATERAVRQLHESSKSPPSPRRRDDEDWARVLDLLHARIHNTPTARPAG
jgi:hypothetical protein